MYFFVFSVVVFFFTYFHCCVADIKTDNPSASWTDDWFDGYNEIE